MLYKNMLGSLPCNNCRSKEHCFLQQIPLQKYPEATQSFVIHLPQSIFSYNGTSHRWYAHYWSVENEIIALYNSQNCFIPENKKYPLSVEAQRDSDRKYIRETFKHLLEIAAKATEDTDPKASIIFDGIGLVLASDYLEAVHKVLSMFNTYGKIVNANETACPNYSS